MKYWIRVISLCLLCSFAVGQVAEVSAASLKQTYTKRYKKLEKKCKKLFNYYDDPYASQATINQEAADEFKLWDKELNYQYKGIYKALSASKKKELKSRQIKWIQKKEKEAKADAAENEGGSLAPLLYYSSLRDSTKKRIKWLIKNYA